MFVEATEERFVVDDIPDAVLDFFEPDVFVVERLAQEMLAGVQAEGAGSSSARTLDSTP